jgi:hypothetical protein
MLAGPPLFMFKKGQMTELINSSNVWASELARFKDIKICECIHVKSTCFTCGVTEGALRLFVSLALMIGTPMPWRFCWRRSRSWVSWVTKACKNTWDRSELHIVVKIHNYRKILLGWHIYEIAEKSPQQWHFEGNTNEHYHNPMRVTHKASVHQLHHKWQWWAAITTHWQHQLMMVGVEMYVIISQHFRQTLIQTSAS